MAANNMFNEQQRQALYDMLYGLGYRDTGLLSDPERAFNQLVKIKWLNKDGTLSGAAKKKFGGTPSVAALNGAPLSPGQQIQQPIQPQSQQPAVDPYAPNIHGNGAFIGPRQASPGWKQPPSTMGELLLSQPLVLPNPTLFENSMMDQAGRETGVTNEEIEKLRSAPNPLDSVEEMSEVLPEATIERYDLAGKSINANTDAIAEQIRLSREQDAYGLQRYYDLMDRLTKSQEKLGSGNPFIDMLDGYINLRKQSNPDYKWRGLIGMGVDAAKNIFGRSKKNGDDSWVNYPHQSHPVAPASISSGGNRDNINAPELSPVIASPDGETNIANAYYSPSEINLRNPQAGYIPHSRHPVPRGGMLDIALNSNPNYYSQRAPDVSASVGSQRTTAPEDAYANYYSQEQRNMRIGGARANSLRALPPDITYGPRIQPGKRSYLDMLLDKF
jgi:hypothetical protein